MRAKLQKNNKKANNNYEFRFFFVLLQQISYQALRFVKKMKKCMRLFFAVLLAMIFLFIGSGINIMRCAHSGTVKLMTAFGMSSIGVEDKDCCMTSHCITVTHIELSPTTAAQQETTDFHIIQPLLAVLPCFVAEWLRPTVCKTVVQSVCAIWKSPPRAYLNFIRVLII